MEKPPTIGRKCETGGFKINTRELGMFFCLKVEKQVTSDITGGCSINSSGACSFYFCAATVDGGASLQTVVRDQNQESCGSSTTETELGKVMFISLKDHGPENPGFLCIMMNLLNIKVPKSLKTDSHFQPGPSL